MNKLRPVHAARAGFPVADDVLQVGGIPLTRLARRVGTTPFYAYDRKLISARVAELRRCLPPEVHLHYAIKANPMPAVVHHLAALVDGLDVASATEMRIALDSGIDAAQISLAGPGKQSEELARAIAAGVVINIESEAELERVATLGTIEGARPRVALRVNPDFELKSSGMKMGGGAKPFGIDSERVPSVLKRVGELSVDFRGFHIYGGSQSLRTESVMETQQKTVELALSLAQHAPSPACTLNIGGGFGIPYFPGESPLDIVAIGAHLTQLMIRIRTQLPRAGIVIELGRYLVGEAGIYVCRVIERKVSRGRTFLITDGGLHHHLAASGNFGQVIRKNYPVVVGNRVVGAERETVSVVGPLCTPLDVLAEDMELAKSEVGDLIVVFKSGAYGLTASPTAFLSHPAPVEVLV